MVNYILISHELVEEEYPQYRFSAQLPNGYHILPMSAMRFLRESDVLIKSEAEIRAMRGSVATDVRGKM